MYQYCQHDGQSSNFFQRVPCISLSLCLSLSLSLSLSLRVFLLFTLPSLKLERRHGDRLTHTRTHTYTNAHTHVHS